MDSPRHLWCVVIAAAIAACTPSGPPAPHHPSKESNFLQKQLVPAMDRWSQTSSPALRLYRSPIMRTFDHICRLYEYADISDIRSELPQVTKYRGAIRDPFSNYDYRVPEMKIAIIGVKGDTAHVAHLELNRWLIPGTAKKLCYQADRAMLVRQYRKRGETSAKLQEHSGS